MRDFWQGFKDDDKNHLYLKSWESICTPREVGGLGFQRTKDVNKAFVTKLGWYLCNKQEKTWVKIMKSKYLRGRKLLDIEQTLRKICLDLEETQYKNQV